jgi:hypothetical protein
VDGDQHGRDRIGSPDQLAAIESDDPLATGPELEPNGHADNQGLPFNLGLDALHHAASQA